MAGQGASGHQSAGLHRALLQQSGVFLIDTAGAVRYARSAYLPTGSFSADELLDAVVKLVGAA